MPRRTPPAEQTDGFLANRLTRRRFWRFELEDGPHFVELAHNYWSGRREVYLDGERIAQVLRNFVDNGGWHDFEVAGHKCRAAVVYKMGIDYTYRFRLDGQWLETSHSPASLDLLRPADEPVGDGLLRPAGCTRDQEELLRPVDQDAA